MFYSNKLFTSKNLLAVSIAFCCSENALANDSSPQEIYLALGAGYAHESSLYLNGKSKSYSYPSIDIYWRNMFLKDYKIGAYFAGGNIWALNLSYGLDNREDIKRGGSDLSKSMPDLKNVFVASLEGEFHNTIGDFNMIYSMDTSNEHNGKIIDLGYSYPWVHNKHFISLELKASWISNDVAQYYYGIQTNNLPAYQASDSINWSYGINYDYSISPHVFLSTSVIFSQFSKEIKRSPIVEKTERNRLLLGLIYMF
jgi:outer membrane protein